MTNPAYLSNLARMRPVKLSAVERKARVNVEREREAHTKRSIDSIAGYLDRLEASAADLTLEIERLQRRRNTICARASRSEERLIAVIQRAGVKELFGYQRTLERWENSVATLVVDNDEEIPIEYMRQPKPAKPAPNKVAMKAALEKDADLVIPGVHLANTVNLRRK
jgi:hypothetical protein